MSHLVDFAFSRDRRGKIKESEKINKYLNLGRAEETVEHESDGEISCNRCTWNNKRVKNLTILPYIMCKN